MHSDMGLRSIKSADNQNRLSSTKPYESDVTVSERTASTMLHLCAGSH